MCMITNAYSGFCMHDVDVHAGALGSLSPRVFHRKRYPTVISMFKYNLLRYIGTQMTNVELLQFDHDHRSGLNCLMPNQMTIIRHQVLKPVTTPMMLMHSSGYIRDSSIV